MLGTYVVDIAAELTIWSGMDITPTQALENARRAAAGSDVVVKDLWTLSLQRVFQFKTGPFFEHSVG